MREFLMKDAYSFHANLESLGETYEKMYAAYERNLSPLRRAVRRRSKLNPARSAAARSHEFMTPCDAGEDVIVTSDRGNYAANLERRDRTAPVDIRRRTARAAREASHARPADD